MQALQKTLFIIALLALLPQTVRHLYVRWFEPTSSVLDKYEPPVKEGIKQAGSLDELVKQYDEAKKKAGEAKKTAEDETRKKASEAEGHDAAVVYQAPDSEREILKAAIQEWEAGRKRYSSCASSGVLALFFCSWGCFATDSNTCGRG